MSVGPAASFARLARAGWRSLLDLVYPPRCGGCGRFRGTWWCGECDASVPRLSGALAWRELITDGGRLIEVGSAARYGGALRTGIHAFKYGATPQLGDAFGAMMAEAWNMSGRPAGGALVAVPLHAKRLRERGYNQSERLAMAMGQLASHRVLPAVLQRRRMTSQQARLNAEQRRENVRAAFSARGALSNVPLIILVDDVFTTGATLGECADALFEAQAPRVMAFTLARADD